VKTFASPVDLDLFNLSTVFEVCDVGRGNLAISKLLALKNFGPFFLSKYYWMSCSTFLGGGEGCHISVKSEGVDLNDWTLIGSIRLSLQGFNAESLPNAIFAIKVLERGVHHKRV
jgi:hypothetical protein